MNKLLEQISELEAAYTACQLQANKNLEGVEKGTQEYYTSRGKKAAWTVILEGTARLQRHNDASGEETRRYLCYERKALRTELKTGIEAALTRDKLLSLWRAMGKTFVYTRVIEEYTTLIEERES